MLNMDTVGAAMLLALKWGLPAFLIGLEVWLIIRLLRGHGAYLFPAFTTCLILLAVGFVFRSLEFYQTHLAIHVGMIPIKIWCVYEAIRMRAKFLIDATPKHVKGETWLMSKSTMWVSVVMMAMACFIRIQYNVPKELMRIHLAAQVGLSTVLLLSWGYFRIRSTKSPRRAYAHHTILTGWLLLYTITNLVPAPGRGEGTKWWLLNYGSLLGGIALMICWLRLFRDTRGVIAVGAHAAPASSTPPDRVAFAGSPSDLRR